MKLFLHAYIFCMAFSIKIFWKVIILIIKSWRIKRYFFFFFKLEHVTVINVRLL